MPVALANDELLSAYSSYEPASGSCSSGYFWIDPATGDTNGRMAPVVASPVVTIEHGRFTLTTRDVGTVDGRCTGTSISVDVLGRPPFGYFWGAAVPGVSASPFSLMSTPPMVVDGAIFVANGSTLSKFPLAGCGALICTHAWAVEVGVPIDNAAPVGGESGQVYVMPTGGPLLAVSAEDGAELWRVDVAGDPPTGRRL